MILAAVAPAQEEDVPYTPSPTMLLGDGNTEVPTFIVSAMKN